MSGLPKIALPGSPPDVPAFPRFECAKCRGQFIAAQFESLEDLRCHECRKADATKIKQESLAAVVGEIDKSYVGAKRIRSVQTLDGILTKLIGDHFTSQDAFAHFWHEQLMIAARDYPGSQKVLNQCSTIAKLVHAVEALNQHRDDAITSRGSLEARERMLALEVVLEALKEPGIKKAPIVKLLQQHLVDPEEIRDEVPA